MADVNRNYAYLVDVELSDKILKCLFHCWIR